MSLELKSSSQWWYGRFTVGGRRRRVNLNVKAQGIRPATLADQGDATFERSRIKAMVAHERMLEELERKQNAEELRQRVMEIKTGARVEAVALETLPDAWEALPRRQKPTERYLKIYRQKLVRFVEHMRQRHPDVAELAAVQADHLRSFMDAESDRNVSARSWNIMLSLLRGVFRKFEPGADAYRRYLLQTPSRKEETIHREPYSPEEIEIILKAAETDELVGPMVVVAICTAMRRGDSARLEWSSVDLDEGFIAVKTGKTGALVEIPIMPRLRQLLEEAATKRIKGERYVFPETARKFEKSPDTLDRKLKGLLRRAGFVDAAEANRDGKRPKAEEEEALETLPLHELRARGLAAIEDMQINSRKRDNMKLVFESYMAGASMAEVSETACVSKSTVSAHLRAIERAIGAKVVRWRAEPAAEVVRGELHGDSGDAPRLRRGSVRGWHAFRTSFVTMALSAGMPMELVQRVTGHSTVAVVQKHYFRPGREQFKKAFEAAMPAMLSEGAKSPADEIQEIVARMTSGTLEEDKARLLQLMA